MSSNPLSKVLSAPLGDIIAEMGLGVAEAQFAIDAKTIENMKKIYTLDDDIVKELRNIGYRPTWYVIPEAHAEINIALSVGQVQTSSGSRKSQLFGATVDASYQNQYDYKMEASSKLTLKFAPVPAPAQIDDMDVVPQLVGLNFGAAKIILDRLSMDFEAKEGFSDTKIVTSTTPSAGEFVEQGTVITIQ